MGHLAEGKQGSEGLGHGDLGEDLELKGGGVKCAKEKNRQAQRRFRERQKCLIQTLKDREEALRKQVFLCRQVANLLFSSLYISLGGDRFSIQSLI